ncbi:MAG: DeoR/GlpR family DNA-binding transcription regulator [Tissierellia bacterium]|nr:DeoR/GlpR family DNA-binding transcription regulator [Tissierellia bacterium]
MFQVERQEKILKYINKNKKSDTKQLSDEFGVSKVTIRRDINLLADRGLIIKTHGGAVSIKNTQLYEIPYNNKVSLNKAAKQNIGVYASKLIEDGDIIILDAGSTTFEIAKNINNTNVTVLSNDVKIAMELAHKKNVNLLISGGYLNGPVYTLTGSQSVNFFKNIHVNKTFLGCDALDLDFGISNRTYEEVEMKKAMIEAAEEVIMVADSSKLHKKVFCFLCDFSVIDKLIIDKIDEPTKKILTEKGVEVIIA